MTKLSQFLENNKDKAYAFAAANTLCNEQGRPVISRDDEWRDETEWDDLFTALTARVSKVMLLQPEDFIFKIGQLNQTDLDRIVELYIKFMNEK